MGTWISKSTFINLADSHKHQFQPSGFAYLPAGTRFIAFDKTVEHRSSQRRLILTETGLWGFIKDSDGHFWNPSRLDIFRENERLAIIRERESITSKLSPEVSLNIWFTPSEIYPLTGESDETLTVSVGPKKIGALSGNTNYSVKISRSLATIIDTNNLELDGSSIHDFGRHQFDDVVGVQKACGVQKVRTVRIGGSAGIDLSKLFSFLKLEGGGSLERKAIEDFGPMLNVTRWYYRRGMTGEMHRITKKQNCSTGRLDYSYVSPAGFEAEFKKGREDQVNFSFEPSSGRVLVTCAREYFQLAEHLVEFGIEPREVPFVISRTARFKNTHDAANCHNP